VVVYVDLFPDGTMATDPTATRTTLIPLQPELQPLSGSSRPK